jgi:nitrite reductase/ring-hydroxylating ferredoxin subunit/uncharacterized membrane protein
MSTTAPAPAGTGGPDGQAPPLPHELQSSPTLQAVGVLEEMSWLEPLGEQVDALLRPVVERRGLMDLLHGRWLGHALHPVLSDLPIGFWSAVPVLDLFGDDAGATVLTGAGCAGAVATALTGVADWTATHGREKRLGLLHGLVNSVGLSLQIGSLWARLAGRRGSGRALSLAGLGISSAAAFLGGELVFGRGIMVDHTAWVAGPSEWTAVLDDAALGEGETRAAQVGGRQVLLARVDGQVSAMEDACSHAGGPLSEGTVCEGVVTCPWHGSQFRLRDGAVVGGPATFPQLRLQARVAGGRIEVRGREG